jgi:cytochrome c-type biogenesis protein CcmE
VTDLGHDPELTAGSTLDAGPDLSPRPMQPERRRRRGVRRWAPGAIVATVLVLAAIVLFQGLSNASVYFCNADEVGKRSECRSDKRFRLQGNVDTGSVVAGPPLHFTVTYNGATIPVSYQGQPGGIFREGIPVVIEGRMLADGTFAGDRILVKHTEQYRQKNPDRVTDYDQ